MPAHICNLFATSQILGPDCANLVVASPVITSNNLCSLTIKCWCIHPNLIPRERINFVLEPVQVRGPPLSMDPAEISYHSRPTLRYRVLIDILLVEDWHSLPDFSSDDGHDDGGGRGDGYHQRCFLRSWLKRVRFDWPEENGSDIDGDGGGGAAPAHWRPQCPSAAKSGRQRCADRVLTMCRNAHVSHLPEKVRISAV
jgi:hypothetical protein